MSEHTLDSPTDRLDTPTARSAASAERDLIELSVRKVSRFAGYFSLAAAVVGIAYLVIR